MQHRFLTPIAAALAGLAVVVACGDSDGGGGGDADAGADAHGDGPVRAPFGLDTRPPNATCKAPARLTTATSIKLTPVFTNLTFQAPTGLLQAPGDPTKWYVVEQGESGVEDATIQVFDNDPNVALSTPFLTIPAAEIATGLPDNEGGLLGFAFHPDYANNGTALLGYTVHSGTSPVDMKAIVTRIKKKAGALELDRATEEIITDGTTPFAADKQTILHNNGQLAFGPDGLLYIAMGDGGEVTGVNGQSMSTIFGKVHRVAIGPTGPYTIPPTNPFVGQGGKRGEIWAYGFRNPYKMSFDRVTGDLWLGDVGDETWEEVDKVVKGGNYGWAIAEGNHCFGNPQCSLAGLSPPVVEYKHESGNVAVVGGYVYRGAKIPALQGSYLFSDHLSGRIWRVVHDEQNRPAMEELLVTGFPVTAFAEDADGELYVMNYAGGKIFRVDPDGAPGTGTPFPQTLSATGCVDPSDPKKVAAGVIPYDINAPLWSDGSDKHRWLALPDGAQITVGPNGDLDFPSGSVLVKEFLLGGKRVETRLLVRHDDGVWAGYSYEWNDAETDATLLPGSKTKTVGAQSWSYPSRTECMQCHTAAAGRVLGPEVGQLNGDAVYPTTNRIANQLATLEHIGMFSAPVGDPAGLARYPRLDGPEPLEPRARAYLHANCAHCHQPGGGTNAKMDLRFAVPLAGANLCNAAPDVSDLGVTGAKLLAPGDPNRSVLSIRLRATDSPRMPPLGRALVHPEGTQVIDDWIRSLAACP